MKGKYLITTDNWFYAPDVKEVTEKDGMEINMYDPNMKYRGIKVLRSLDLLEGEFEM